MRNERLNQDTGLKWLMSSPRTNRWGTPEFDSWREQLLVTLLISRLNSELPGPILLETRGLTPKEKEMKAL
jgi:hypothetical protein